MLKLRKNPLILVVAALGTIGFVAFGKIIWEEFKSRDKVVVLEIPAISLPFITDEGVMLSSIGLPRGFFKVPPNQEIKKVQLTAVLLDSSHTPIKIKQVLLVGGSFPIDSEFELSDKYNRKINLPAQVIDRIQMQVVGAKSKFFYLFNNLNPDSLNGSNMIAISLNSRIPVDHISIRRVGSEDGLWLDLDFLRTSSNPLIAPHNKRDKKITFKAIVAK